MLGVTGSFIWIFSKTPEEKKTMVMENTASTTDLNFTSRRPKTTKDKHWVKVGKILGFDSESKFEDYRDTVLDALPDDVTKNQLRVARRNLERLYRAVWKDEVIAYYTETDQDYDRVLDILSVRTKEERNSVNLICFFRWSHRGGQRLVRRFTDLLTF